MKHVKLYDAAKGQVDLYLMVLMPGGFDVYILENVSINFVDYLSIT